MNTTYTLSLAKTIFLYRFGIWCFVKTVDFPVFNDIQYLGKNMSEKAIEEMWEQTARGCKYN